jgi:FkbM family methyltransferase
MLISVEKVRNLLEAYGIAPRGVLHVGAHDCEELDVYIALKINPNNVHWIEAIEEKVREARARGVANVYHAAVSNADDTDVIFYRTNNDQSSSILPLETHLQHYPWITVKEEIRMKTVTLDTLLVHQNIDPSLLEFWNLDIQGAELLALRGGTHALQYAKAVYLEVNKEHLYRDCALMNDIDAFLGPMGFIRIESAFTPEGWGDALYVRSGLCSAV